MLIKEDFYTPEPDYLQEILGISNDLDDELAHKVADIIELSDPDETIKQVTNFVESLDQKVLIFALCRMMRASKNMLKRIRELETELVE